MTRMIKKFAGALATITIVILFSSLCFAQSGPITIFYVEGPVSVKSSDGKWIPAKEGMPLNEKTTLKTSEFSKCDIFFGSTKNVISVDYNTEIIVKDMQKVRITSGRIFSILDDLEKGSSFEIISPQAIAGVRGTSWETTSSGSGDISEFRVADGVVNVAGVTPEGDVTGENDVKKGYFVSVGEDGFLGELLKMTKADMRRLSDWRKLIERRIASLEKRSCSDIIDNYFGGFSDLFSKVLQCEAEEGEEAFAAAEAGGIDLPVEDAGLGITGGDITNRTFGPGTPPEIPDIPIEEPVIPEIPTGGGGGCGCFLAGTMITMADGSQKLIETLKVGDTVLSFDEEANELKPDTVTELLFHEEDNTHVVINGHLKATPNHPMLSNGEWVHVGDLKIGDTLTKANGEKVIIASLIKVNEITDVYNFEVNPYHTYIANGYIAHNGTLPASQQHKGGEIFE